MGKGTRLLACLTAAAAVAAGTVGSAGAAATEPPTLGPIVQEILARRIDNCLDRRLCSIVLYRRLARCDADAACSAALAEFLAANPEIAEALGRGTATG